MAKYYSDTHLSRLKKEFGTGVVKLTMLYGHDRISMETTVVMPEKVFELLEEVAKSFSIAPEKEK